MKRLHALLAVSMLSALLLSAASCNTIFEDEQDCSPKIRFELRKHRQALYAVNGNAADVFGSTVGSVHLFVFDETTGECVTERFESTQNLLSEADLRIGTGRDKTIMRLDGLQPGKYRLVAWCGLDENDQNNAFALAKGARAAQTDYDRCRVITNPDGSPVADARYDACYHGAAQHIEITGSGEIIPVQLTKNNNDIAVWVQHAYAQLETDEYEVVFVDNNGTMDFHSNDLTDDTRLEYRPHTTSYLQTETEYNGALVEAGALIAHISTARLLASHSSSARLEVRNREGLAVFSIPFVKYLLEMQTLTADGQYYLDCEDTYNCSFYLTGDGNLWMPMQIIINNWVKVPDQQDVI